MSTGQRIRALREGRGLSRAELARAVEVSQTAVYNWEELNMRPRGHTMPALCRILGTSEEFLLSGTNVAAVAATRSPEQILREAREALAQVLGLPADRIRLRLEIEG